MTLPFNPSGALPTANDGRGSFVQMGGGYEASIAQANANNRGGPPPIGVPQYGAPAPGAQPTGPVWGAPQAPAAPMRGMPGAPGSFMNAQLPVGYNAQGQPLYAAPQVPAAPAPGMPPAGWPGSNGPAPLWQGAPAPQAPAQFWSPPQGQLPAAPAPVNLDERLTGTDVPPELQGRSVRELIGIHNGLRQVHLRGMSQGQPAPVPQYTPAPVPAPTPGAPPAGQWDWRNPEQAFGRVVDERIGRMLDEKLAPMLAPMLQQTTVNAINTARSQAIAQVGPQLYAQIEPMINESLQGVDPRALTNPTLWTLAAERAVGALTMRGGRVQQPAPAPDPRAPGVYPVQQPGNGQPIPNLPLFFSEQPNQGGPVAGRAQLSDAHRQAAYLMNMSEDQYVAWGGLR